MLLFKASQHLFKSKLLMLRFPEMQAHPRFHLRITLQTFDLPGQQLDSLGFHCMGISKSGNVIVSDNISGLAHGRLLFKFGEAVQSAPKPGPVEWKTKARL